jgi:hypothetical protein
MNTEIEITSCMIFSCHMSNGPSFSFAPILFAGTIRQYSISAMPQLMAMVPTNPMCCKNGTSLKRKWPYHAKVMKVLLPMSSRIVWSDLGIGCRGLVVGYLLIVNMFSQTEYQDTNPDLHFQMEVSLIRRFLASIQGKSYDQNVINLFQIPNPIL